MPIMRPALEPHAGEQLYLAHRTTRGSSLARRTVRPETSNQRRTWLKTMQQPTENANHGSPDDCILRHTVAASRSPAILVNHIIPSTVSRRSSGLCRSSLRLSTLLVVTILALLAVSPVTAVRVPFRNCLDENYRSPDREDQLRLQWVPLEAEATYHNDGGNHNLEFIVWGDVNGSYNRFDRPDPSDPYWSNDQETEGKIVRTPEPDAAKPKATTLWRRANVLTFMPWDDFVDFCQKGIDGGTCPLAPRFADLNAEDFTDLPSINLTNSFSSSYAFSTLSATMSIIYGNSAATEIGCVTATITPSLGSLAPVIKFIPLVILILIGFAVVFASISSPWGSSDVFHWTSNYGRDADLLRLVTPGFSDCLQYIQFVVLAGGLSLNYPGFYQPVVSQVGWSALMFNSSLVSGNDSYVSVIDGMYMTDADYGLQRLAQLVGIAETQDIWAGMMVWLAVIIGIVTLVTQSAFVFRWLYRTINGTAKEDLRDKNLPFTVGNIVRIVYNYLLLPIVALSAFQLVVAGEAPAYLVALASLTIVLLVIFAAWLLWFIIKTEPKSVLFDDLPTVLRYGPLYNTYSDQSAPFALIPVVLTFLRGIGIGAFQFNGIAQVVLLAISEVIQILTLHAFRPFNPPTSMNAYHTVFSSLRLITTMLMIAFAPPLSVSEGIKGWIGYVILLIHGLVLVLGFFLNSLQTIVEVVALMLGAGGDDRGLTRGGLSKIFGMRQLSRRPGPREGPSRASQLSTSAMLDAEEGSKTGYTMPSGRIRSESGASLGGIMSARDRQRSDSALDSIDLYSTQQRPLDGGSSYTPGTPGGETTFSFITSLPSARGSQPVVPPEAAGPYYRPPRRRRETFNESLDQLDTNPQSRSEPKQLAQGLGGPVADAADLGAEISRGATPAVQGGGNPASFLPNRPDYSTREVDFYYGVRGPALNSDGPKRTLGTGPADPTGPVATASGWFRNMFGGKTKEKGKGFEVVRSARMPPQMARNVGFGDETPPEGIPVAMGVLRNGPIDSDDEDEPKPKPLPKLKEGVLLNDVGEPHEASEGDLQSPVAERLPRGNAASQAKEPGEAQQESDNDNESPDIPRKSSKRHSALVESSQSNSESQQQSQADSASHDHKGSRAPSLASLPFARSNSQKSGYTMDFPLDLAQHTAFQPGREERPASFGVVSQHSTTRVDPYHQGGHAMESTAELVDERSSRRSGQSSQR